MLFRKGLLFIAIVTVTILTNSLSAQAANLSELPLSGYSLQNDPYLLDWTFQVTQNAVATPTAELSHEDKILARWKEKQLHMWNNLPTGEFEINASAYTAAADECGKNDGITASGLLVQEQRTLACPKEYPFGTKIHIAGLGDFRCEDRGGAIKANKFDIYMKTKSEAFGFGRQHLTARVIQ
ncbi:MAG: 3D domain-containing protein [Patescibacteria group bacterium]